jgi:hypothetical protein
MTILRQSILLVSVLARGYSPAMRAKCENEPDQFGTVDTGPEFEICAGARVDVTGDEDGDECLCEMFGHEFWIERRYLS